MKFLHYVTLFAVCAYGARATDRIVGGASVTDPTKYPYVVAILFNEEAICAGFIYNDRWVATAASCLNGKDEANLLVTIGSTSLITPGPEEQLIPVREVQIHPSYNSETGFNDIALLQPSRPIRFGDSAQAIRFGEVLQPVDGVSHNVIAGWGATFEGGLIVPSLREASVPHVDNSNVNCQRSFGTTGFDTSYMICAGGGAASPCGFDEGVPLVQFYSDGNRTVVGVLSKEGSGCDATLSPSVYTRLSAYNDWLLEIAGQQPANVY